MDSNVRTFLLSQLNPSISSNDCQTAPDVRSKLCINETAFLSIRTPRDGSELLAKRLVRVCVCRNTKIHFSYAQRRRRRLVSLSRALERVPLCSDIRHAMSVECETRHRVHLGAGEVNILWFLSAVCEREGCMLDNTIDIYVFARICWITSTQYNRCQAQNDSKLSCDPKRNLVLPAIRCWRLLNPK